jgi:hypothetical protein
MLLAFRSRRLPSASVDVWSRCLRGQFTREFGTEHPGEGRTSTNNCNLLEYTIFDCNPILGKSGCAVREMPPSCILAAHRLATRPANALLSFESGTAGLRDCAYRPINVPIAGPAMRSEAKHPWAIAECQKRRVYDEGRNLRIRRRRGGRAA